MIDKKRALSSPPLYLLSDAKFEIQFDRGIQANAGKTVHLGNGILRLGPLSV